MTDAAAPAPDTVPAPQKATGAAGRGPIRNFLENIGMAILMAVLLKYFVLEAYVIPTPSMQPTLQGSPEAGETDRILVDKSYYLFHEPERWNIAVFRYPVRQIQSYVKRIVGMPGDRLRILGGNLYRVSADGKSLEILRKPLSIQRSLWREIYPMRRLLANYDKSPDDYDRTPRREDVFGPYFAQVAGTWTIDAEGRWVGEPRGGRLALSLRSLEAVNRYVDGYDADVASVIRKKRGSDEGGQAVQDLRIGFDLTPEKAPEKLTVEIEVVPMSTSFSLIVEKGKGVVAAERSSDKRSKRSDPFDFPFSAGAATSIRFARLDDRLLAWRDGDLVASLDVDEFAIRKDLEPGAVSSKLEIRGPGKSRLQDVRIERDLHYTRSLLPEDHIISVPDGHYFMMGDNTLGSADSRDWTAIQIGVDADGNVVNPDSARAVRKLWGNKRPKPIYSSEAPHNDDNPVPVTSRDRIVFVDERGETHTLKGKVNEETWGLVDQSTAGKARLEFLADTPWSPPEKASSFVPREHIEGRPVARFLRNAASLKFASWIR